MHFAIHHVPPSKSYRSPAHITLKLIKMTQNSQTNTRAMRQKRNHIRDHIRPIVDRLDARWLSHCANEPHAASKP